MKKLATLIGTAFFIVAVTGFVCQGEEAVQSEISGGKENRFILIPLLGNAVGNATVEDVLVGKTFSNSTATGLTGTRAHAPVEKTGQTGCWDSSGTSIPCDGTGQDGEYQKGVAWPSPRFTANIDNNGDGDCDDVGETCDGTVTDNLTGLIWLKNANCANSKDWTPALTFANSLYDGWTGDLGGGDCGLGDASIAGDWRLPNVKELQSLIDFGNIDPALPSGHPFMGVQNYYWSSNTRAYHYGGTNQAWFIALYNGVVGTDDKTNTYYHYHVWPVRGGQ